MNIKLEFNEEDLKRITQKLDEQTTDSMSMVLAMNKAMAKLERKAKEKAPKDTGALRRSITSKVEREGDELVGTVYTPLEYAPYIEYGTGLFAENGNGRKDVPWNYQDDKGEWHSTRGQHPQSFMRPALNESREEILRTLKREMFKEVND